MQFSELEQTIGAEAAVRLSEAFGGELQWIPHPPRKDAGETKSRALAMHRRGFTTRQIAVQLGVTMRRVQQILQKGRK